MKTTVGSFITVKVGGMENTREVVSRSTRKEIVVYVQTSK